MPQPTPYKRLVDFTEDTPANTDHNGLNTEFSRIEATMSEILANMALIQRDDTQLSNLSVGLDQLRSEIFDALGIDTPTWINETTHGGDMYGPPASADNALVRFNGDTGKSAQNSPLNTLTDSGSMRWESAQGSGQGIEIRTDGVIAGWGNWTGTNILTLNGETGAVTVHGTAAFNGAITAASLTFASTYTPTTALSAATKGYVDGIVSSIEGFVPPSSTTLNGIMRYGDTSGDSSKNSNLNTIDDTGNLKWESGAGSNAGFQIMPSGMVTGWGTHAGNDLLQFDAENDKVELQTATRLPDAYTPTDDREVVPKSYVDGLLQQVSVTAGQVSGGALIPLPSGYSRSQCKYIVSPAAIYGQESNESWELLAQCSVNQSTGLVTCTRAQNNGVGDTELVNATANYICIAIK